MGLEWGLALFLKLQGEMSATLLLTRQGEREIAILAQRCPRKEQLPG